MKPARYQLLERRPEPPFPNAAILDRAQGCLLGQIAGDSLGGRVEFQDSATICFEHPTGVRTLVNGGHWNILAGQPTDDSELALALARSLVHRGRYDEDDVIAAYVAWYDSIPFDRGTTIDLALSRAARAEPDNAAKRARDVASTTSQANGALMRISPLGIFAHALSPSTAGELARVDARLTHPHLVCQDANAVFVATIAHAIKHGGGAKQVHRFALDYSKPLHPLVTQAIYQATLGKPDDFMTHMGWVLIALQNAFWQLLHSPTLEEGVVDTVMQGGDSDTNAAIAGALLGAVHGARAIPEQWRGSILSCRPASGRRGVLRPRPEMFWPVDSLLLAEHLLVRGSQFASHGTGARSDREIGS